MSLALTIVSKMPSENSFKKQADVARDALKAFNAVRSLNAPSATKAALSELVEATVCFSIKFLAHFLFLFF